jgi:WD40 repeat protein
MDACHFDDHQAKFVNKAKIGKNSEMSISFRRSKLALGMIILVFASYSCGRLALASQRQNETPAQATSTVIPNGSTDLPAPQITFQPQSDAIEIGPLNANSLVQIQVLSQGETQDFSWLQAGDEIALSSSNSIITYGLDPLSQADLVGTVDPALMTVSPDQETVAWVSPQTMINVWRTGQGDSPHSLGENQAPVTALAFSQDGADLAYSTYDGLLKVWDIANQQVSRQWQAPSWISNLSYSPDGTRLGGADLANFLVYIFDSSTGEVLQTLQWIGSASPALYSVHFSPDWSSLAWTARGTVQLMNVSDGNLGPSLDHEDFVSAMAWTPDGRIIATAAAGTIGGNFLPIVYIWETANGQKLAEHVQQQPVQSLSFSPDGTQLAILTVDGLLSVLQVAR